MAAIILSDTSAAIQGYLKLEGTNTMPSDPPVYIEDKVGGNSALSISTQSVVIRTQGGEDTGAFDSVTVYGRTTNTGRALLVKNYDSSVESLSAYDDGSVTIYGPAKVTTINDQGATATRFLVQDAADKIIKYRTADEVYTDLATKVKVLGVVLPVASWTLSGGFYQQIVTNAAITANSWVTFIPVLTSGAVYAAAGFQLYNAPAAGYVTFYCISIPSAAITANLNVLK